MSLTSRRRTAVGPLSALESFALNLPDFLRVGSSAAIPLTVTARGYDTSMPVAYEPEVTVRTGGAEEEEDGNDGVERDSEEEEEADHFSAASLATQTNASNASATAAEKHARRRSTLPIGAALLQVAHAPPLLYPSLAPSCDLCSGSGSGSSHPSQIWCEECELYLCGSEAIDDGLPPAAVERKRAPRACNYSLHRHTAMQGHVRVPASTHRWIEKMVHESGNSNGGESKEDASNSSSDVSSDSSSQPPSSSSIRKSLVLRAFALAMRGVAWQLESARVPGVWLDFDVASQERLELALGPSSSSGVREVTLTDQYVVRIVAKKNRRRRSAGTSRFQMTHTLSRRIINVRRLDAHALSTMNDGDISDSNATLPNSRPSTARRARAPVSPSRPDEVNGASGATSPVSSVAPVTSALGTPRGADSVRPSLSRFASADARSAAAFSEWRAEAWLAFAEAQPPLVAGEIGSRGFEVAPVVADGDAEDALDSNSRTSYPLFGMERGNALALAAYHGSACATRVLLAKGFSPNARTTWTHLSALQLSCMQPSGDSDSEEDVDGDEVFHLLLASGADAAYVPPAGGGASHTLVFECAARSGRVRVLEKLLELRHQTRTSAEDGTLRPLALAASDMRRREARRARTKKRSTWVDIGAEEDGASPPPPTREDHSIGEPSDPDAGLYPHLLTEVLSVPSSAESVSPARRADETRIVTLLLDAMLERAHKMDPSPAFELSRYHEWLSSCIATRSFSRLSIMLDRRAQYTAHLEEVDALSDDYAETLNDPRFARTTLRPRASIDALLFQACEQHNPAVDEEDELTEEGDERDGKDASSAVVATVDPSHGSFRLLTLLVSHGGDVNHVEVDRSEGTQLSPLFLALRDRKSRLARFLVAHGADPTMRLRCARLERPSDHVTQEDEECVVDEPLSDDSEPDVHWFQILAWSRFVEEECAYDASEVEEARRTIEEGLEQRRQMLQGTINTA